MKRLFLGVALVASHVLNISAYDFSSFTEESIEEDLESVELFYSINPDEETVSLTIGPSVYKFDAIRIPETVTYNDKTYTVTEIAYGAFSGGNINRVEMANTITKIGESAFNNCGINKVSFSTSLKTIEKQAFYISDLTSVILPEGLETIGDYAFCHKDRGTISVSPGGKISEVYLPSTLTSMGVYVFGYNGTLTEITIPEKITQIKNDSFRFCSALDKVNLPTGLLSIGGRAFDGCSLTSMTEDFFPEKLTTIGESAFGSCDFTNIVIPDNVTSIGSSCFSFCSNLTSITFSKGLTKIPSAACYYCSQLIEVIIPEGITKIEGSAFQGTTRLSEITLPESLSEIEYYAFCESGLASATIPSNVEILSGTFTYCKYLKEVILPQNIKEIGGDTFKGCLALETIEIPHSLQTLGYHAFYDCSSLTKITIPHNVSVFGDACFYGCSNLTEMHYKRAILPEIDGNNPRVIHGGNQCTLYVPIGAKATYEASSTWNNFYAIEEEEIGYDITYRLSVSSIGQGEVKVNDVLSTTHDIISGSEVKIEMLPAEGWKTAKVSIDGVDVTSECEDNVYVISDLIGNLAIVVEFEELPAMLELKQADGGSIIVPVVKGTSFTCQFTVEEGWEINNVQFNGNDVTSSVDSNNNYTTPKINADAILSVAYEKIEGAVDAALFDESNVAAYISQSGTLVVEGVENGMPINVYLSDGKNLATLISCDGRATCNLEMRGVYIVKTLTKTIKIAY